MLPAWLALFFGRKQGLKFCAVNNEVHETRDLRLGKTIAIIKAAFLVTWLPFQILILTLSLCNSCLVSPATMNSTKLLHYANSIVNIVIYPARNEV